LFVLNEKTDLKCDKNINLSCIRYAQLSVIWKISFWSHRVLSSISTNWLVLKIIAQCDIKLSLSVTSNYRSVSQCDIKYIMTLLIITITFSGGFKGGAMGASAPPSNMSSTYINIRFSRLVNVTIWLLIEWFRSVWWK
jgi:hypothetical protein